MAFIRVARNKHKKGKRTLGSKCEEGETNLSLHRTGSTHLLILKSLNIRDVTCFSILVKI